MLAHRLQRWPNIEPMPRVCWVGTKRVHAPSGPSADRANGE